VSGPEPGFLRFPSLPSRKKAAAAAEEEEEEEEEEDDDDDDDDDDDEADDDDDDLPCFPLPLSCERANSLSLSLS